MGQLKNKVTIEINTDAEHVWEIVASQFVNVSLWARDVISSRENTAIEKKFSDAPAGGRICEVKGMGEIDERITHFSASKKEITWSANSEKIPGFVSNLQNAFTFHQIDEETTRVTSSLTADLNGAAGLLMGPLVKRNFSKAIATLLEDLDVYARTGSSR